MSLGTLNHSAPSTVNIGLDMRFLEFEESMERGIGLYAYTHAHTLVRHYPQLSFTLIGDVAPDSVLTGQFSKFANVTFHSYDAPLPNTLTFLHLYDPLSLTPGYDCPFLLYNYRPLSSMLYDLIPLLEEPGYLERAPKFYRRMYSARVDRLLKRPDVILTISDHVKNQVTGNLGVSRDKVEVIYAGVDHNVAAKPGAAQMPGGVDLILDSGIPFFLVVGSLEPRKNFDTILEAFLAVEPEIPGIRLVVVGSLRDVYKSRYRQSLEERGVGSVIFLGYVPEQDLDRLYDHAAALLFLSRAEGFGLPIVEAMKKGCPVICSDIPVHKEVGSDVALLCDGSSSAAVAEKMLRAARDPALREWFKEAGPARAARFTWARTVQMTVATWTRHFQLPSSSSLGCPVTE